MNTPDRREAQLAAESAALDRAIGAATGTTKSERRAELDRLIDDRLRAAGVAMLSRRNYPANSGGNQRIVNDPHTEHRHDCIEPLAEKRSQTKFINWPPEHSAHS